MRMLLFVGLLTGCGVDEDEPDWSFDLTISTRDDACREVATYLTNDLKGSPDISDVCGPAGLTAAGLPDEGVDDPPCGDLEREKTEQKMRYDIFFDGASASIEIEGKPFASGLSRGCKIEYSTPTWLEELDGGDVTWKLEAMKQDGKLITYADGTGACNIAARNDWLGIEEITIVESENLDYPVGCTYRTVVTGKVVAQGI